MAKTLYDILELSPSASRDAIRAAYDRLSSRFDPDSDEHRGKADVRMRADAIKEAFFTLGNPEARARYDRSLVSGNAVYTPSVPDLQPTWTMPKIIPIVVALLAGGGWYLNNKHTEQKLAAERAIAEARAKEGEAKAEAQAAEQKRLALQRQRELDRQRNLQENRTRNEFDRNRRDFEREQRRQEMNERLAQDRERREKQNLAQRSEMERQRQDAANVAEARRRAAREKEELCRIERQRYGKAISC